MIGLLSGIIGAFGATQVMRGLLFEVTPTDPITFGLVSLVLPGTTVLACWLPARKAARVNPVEALRC